MEDWGLPEAQIDEARGELARLEQACGGDCEVHRDNWRAVQFFALLGTQWRVALGMGTAVTLGLDYAGVAAAMEMAAVPRSRRRRLWADLQVMEAAALPILNRQATEGAGDGA
jgi:hypothetical protein